MRVVAGELGGRKLVTPDGEDTRPTSERVREAIFNSLFSLDAIDGARVLDLFAGSGALGIEAPKRGLFGRKASKGDTSALVVLLTGQRARPANVAALGLTMRFQTLAAAVQDCRST